MRRSWRRWRRSSCRSARLLPGRRRPRPSSGPRTTAGWVKAAPSSCPVAPWDQSDPRIPISVAIQVSSASAGTAAPLQTSQIDTAVTAAAAVGASRPASTSVSPDRRRSSPPALRSHPTQPRATGLAPVPASSSLVASPAAAAATSNKASPAAAVAVSTAGSSQFASAIERVLSKLSARIEGIEGMLARLPPPDTDSSSVELEEEEDVAAVQQSFQQGDKRGSGPDTTSGGPLTVEQAVERRLLAELATYDPKAESVARAFSESVHGIDLDLEDGAEGLPQLTTRRLSPVSEMQASAGDASGIVGPKNPSPADFAVQETSGVEEEEEEGQDVAGFSADDSEEEEDEREEEARSAHDDDDEDISDEQPVPLLEAFREEPTDEEDESSRLPVHPEGDELPASLLAGVYEPTIPDPPARGPNTGPRQGDEEEEDVAVGVLVRAGLRDDGLSVVSEFVRRRLGDSITPDAARADAVVSLVSGHALGPEEDVRAGFRQAAATIAREAEEYRWEGPASGLAGRVWPRRTSTWGPPLLCCRRARAAGADASGHLDQMRMELATQLSPEAQVALDKYDELLGSTAVQSTQVSQPPDVSDLSVDDTQGPSAVAMADGLDDAEEGDEEEAPTARRKFDPDQSIFEDRASPAELASRFQEATSQMEASPSLTTGRHCYRLAPLVERRRPDLCHRSEVVADLSIAVLAGGAPDAARGRVHPACTAGPAPTGGGPARSTAAGLDRRTSAGAGEPAAAGGRVRAAVPAARAGPPPPAGRAGRAAAPAAGSGLPVTS